MRSRLHVGAAIAAVATTFTFGASASFVEAEDAPPQASAAFTVTDVGDRPAPQLPKELDANDPWEASAKPLPSHRAPKAKPRLLTEDPWAATASPALPPLPAARLDASDPWTTAPPPAKTDRPASTPSRAADDALREAIKRAVDAGDLERAAKLLEILRAR